MSKNPLGQIMKVTVMKTLDIVLPIKDQCLEGFFSVPRDARGLVIFAHGSGSSRFSSRNQHVARFLQSRGYATLLFDLLSHAEDDIDAATGLLRFDIPLLSDRLYEVTRWLLTRPDVMGLPVAFFGASTGAAAALEAASRLSDTIRCVISRGGRPDLAEKALPRVTCPVLLIVGELDETVLNLNQKAKQLLTHSTCELKIVSQASHLFEEPGALEHVARLSADWLDRFCALHQQAHATNRTPFLRT
jgi:putative phosphoribosyl transferase